MSTDSAAIGGSFAQQRAREATPGNKLDTAVTRLSDKAQEFARAPIANKLRWLRELSDGMHAVSAPLAEAAARAKRLDLTGSWLGEEWTSGPAASLRYLRLLHRSLDQIARFGAPSVDPAHVHEREDKRLAVQIFPQDSFDRTLFPKYRAETWLQGIRANELRAHQASFYQQRDPKGGVCLVLGAGNIVGIPIIDVLHKMFVDGEVCILKMNPVNDYAGPFIERAFRSIIERDYLAVVYGGGEVGSYLCHHAGVDSVHVTGSEQTHDAIVWGSDEAAEDRKARNEPLLKKPITSELGNISPVLIVPAPYTQSELRHMARNIAGATIHNASFNCNSPKLLVLPGNWPLRQAFLEELGSAFASVTPRYAYYPGAEERYSRLTEDRSQVIKYGDMLPGTLPWTLVSGLDPASDEPHFELEPFCSILSEVQLPATDPEEYLEAASEFVNNKVWGTLNATLFVHPKHESSTAISAALDRACSRLRYGTIGINCWPALAWGLGQPPWGGHPSSTLQKPQGGIGFVHNTYMFEAVEKTILRIPLKPLPKPIWYPDHRHLDRLMRHFADFEHRPNWQSLAKLAVTAARS